jgi:hypothetical protein
MPGKKAHKPKDPGGEVGNHGVHQHPGHARKSTGQTEGQFGMARSGRKGHFEGTGTAPLIKK